MLATLMYTLDSTIANVRNAAAGHSELAGRIDPSNPLLTSVLPRLLKPPRGPVSNTVEIHGD